MQPVTRKDLDPSPCGFDGCGHDHSELHFHGKCHPSAAVRVVYVKASGELVITCDRCRKMVAHILVAP
jgi:hypothetical protein